ncbi:MAG: sensor domain-containing diguanylate cyclase [Candidatus Omnitrophica bacterium]|nr:sensor domain-containing diguanylate cyclase [Candidatus Omnitrophota bacterium]
MVKQDKLDKLLEISRSLGDCENLERLGDLLVEKIEDLFESAKVSLMLLDKEKKELFIWASSGMRDDLRQVKVQYGSMFAGWVAQQGKPLLVKNIDSEFPKSSKAKLGRYKSKSFLIAPIKTDEKILGVINITERKEEGVFEEDDILIISLLSLLIASSMEKINLLQQLENLSLIDALTGLSNHRFFQEHMSEEVERAQRYRRPLSLIIVDVDNFQEYNETYGYEMGDRVLKQIAQILSENLRKVDIITRYAGEQFAVILPDTNKKQASQVAEKIRDKVASAVFVEKRTSSLAMARLTVSIGVGEYNVANNKEEFIKQGTEAVQEAKQKGKNRVCVVK